MLSLPAALADRPGRAVALDLRMLRALPFAVVCVVVSALGHDLAGGGTVPLPTLLTIGLVVWALATALAGRERSLASIVAGLAVGQVGLHLLFHQVATSSMATIAGMTSMSGMAGMNGMAGMPGMGAAPTAGSGSDALTRLAAALLCGPAGTGTGLTLPPGTTAGEIVSRAGIDPHLIVTGTPQLPFWTHTAILGLSPLMAVGHLLAALVAGWWLRRGEAALWQLLRVTAQLTETLAQAWAAPLRTLLALAAALLRGLLGTLDADAATRPRPDRDDGAGRPPRTAQLRHQVVRRGPPAALPA